MLIHKVFLLPNTTAYVVFIILFKFQTCCGNSSNLIIYPKTPWMLIYLRQ